MKVISNTALIPDKRWAWIINEVRRNPLKLIIIFKTKGE